MKDVILTFYENDCLVAHFHSIPKIIVLNNPIHCAHGLIYDDLYEHVQGYYLFVQIIDSLILVLVEHENYLVIIGMRVLMQ